MFYRYEIRAGEDAPWKGCFQFFFPDQLRYIGRWLKEPKWYKTHPGVHSRCWFTEYGFKQYGRMVEEIIKNRLDSNPDWEMRVIQTEFLENIAVKGKVQYIEIGR